MKKNKIIKVNDTTAIQLPGKELSTLDLMAIQSRIALRNAEAMHELVKLYCAEQEAKRAEIRIQMMLGNENNQRRLN